MIHRAHTADLRPKILDFRGFDSGMTLVLRGGILMSEVGISVHMDGVGPSQDE